MGYGVSEYGVDFNRTEFYGMIAPKPQYVRVLPTPFIRPEPTDKYQMHTPEADEYANKLSVWINDFILSEATGSPFPKPFEEWLKKVGEATSDNTMTTEDDPFERWMEKLTAYNEPVRTCTSRFACRTATTTTNGIGATPRITNRRDITQIKYLTI